MMAHTIQEGGIPAALVFDEIDQYNSGDSPMMETSTAENSTTRLVSPSYDQQTATINCYAMPVPAPASPCTSGESSAPAASAVRSVTGNFSNIESKYQVDPRVLGTGHHGSVRRCIDRATGQQCAVKSIRKSDPSVQMGGLAREIVLLQEMKHHSIIQLVDVFEDAEYLHLVTELCEGGELFDKIAEKASADNGAPCFAEDEAARIMRQILVSVSFMHKHGVVHRDIKPENILFQTTDEDSPIKIIDFGLARKHLHGVEPPMSTVVGTPYYIAPDVLKKKYDKSCDLWSVGVIAYILLCGYPPFNGRNNNETHRAILTGKYRFHSSDWEGVSYEARNFVRGLLDTNPRRRMTVDQALNHPWLAKHFDVFVDDERRVDVSSEYVGAFKAMRLRTKSSVLRGGIAKRKVRKAMFGI